MRLPDAVLAEVQTPRSSTLPAELHFKTHRIHLHFFFQLHPVPHKDTDLPSQNNWLLASYCNMSFLCNKTRYKTSSELLEALRAFLCRGVKSCYSAGINFPLLPPKVLILSSLKNYAPKLNHSCLLLSRQGRRENGKGFAGSLILTVSVETC